jgi:hypothetical protein
VLAAAIPYFHAMFTSNMAESGQVRFSKIFISFEQFRKCFSTIFKDVQQF